MSLVFPSFNRSVVARGADAEVAGGSGAKVKLLVDSSATGGALSTVRVSLESEAPACREAIRARN